MKTNKDNKAKYQICFFCRKKYKVKTKSKDIKVYCSDRCRKESEKKTIPKKRSSREVLEKIVKENNLQWGKFPKNRMFGSNNFVNVQRGDYECSKGSVYFRSKWEANYALYLDFLVKKKEVKSWEFESDVFIFDKIQFGTRSYRPDFKVFTNDGLFEYHEVKGFMDSKSKTKLKRMAKYYPQIKLVLIDSQVYKDIKNKLGKLLNFYE